MSKIMLKYIEKEEEDKDLKEEEEVRLLFQDQEIHVHCIQQWYIFLNAERMDLS